MQPLLDSEQGRLALARYAVPGLLCAFDFDGTLAPIVADPSAVRLPQQVRDQLQALQRHAPVAIITGRAVDDIAPRLGFDPDFLIGNHGMEGLPGEAAAAEAQQHLAICAAWRAQLDSLLAAEYPDPGVQIEDKRFSLSVHYRHAQAAERAQQDLEPLLATLDPPPRLVAGKCVLNLMPPGAADKGRALEQVMQHLGAVRALYVGDDVTDEDVFRLARPDVLSVRIELSQASRAAYYLEHIDHMPRLLDALLQRLAPHLR